MSEIAIKLATTNVRELQHLLNRIDPTEEPEKHRRIEERLEYAKRELRATRGDA